ncbi:(+)-larreatricin hydroxylase, chloroplastic [Sesamum angolense]|uniref:(+)-larreatricin hydroxylase, chloroplastic n=1 Tax=Sesamum angolense TaxID=2727404 RepID=A0AAE1W5L5_9LAMI|nr:(+)-larreatricin hydroxylase, chloroplastic [Sesamum angolense]
MTIPPMFLDSKAAIYDSKRNQDNLKAVVDLGMTGNKDPLQVVANNLTVMYSEMIRGNADVYDFMGQPYREGTARESRAWILRAWFPHRDPRVRWRPERAQWRGLGQLLLGSNKVPNKRITDPDFLNASFLFYDENAQLVRVTVKDTLDNLRMGYDFERVDLPWLDYRPPPQTLKAKIIRTGTTAPKAETLFPLKLEKVVRFQVSKAKKGKADELLVLENITVDTTKYLKFDVFVNDEDDNALELDKAAYAGTYAQVPHKTANRTATTSIRLKLTDLYDDMDIGDDDTIVVTLVPRHQGPGVTIGGIKVIENPPATSSS